VASETGRTAHLFPRTFMSTHDLSFSKAAETSEIPVGKTKRVKSRNTEVLIMNVNGSFYAIANPCTYKGGCLSEGSLEGKIVTCPQV
jgi:nitrite reductase/ring-hydroxylating ferredoxin subunit